MNLNKTISALRAERGMTQEKLAELVGVSTAAVSKWECGNSYPDITLLTKLAEIFDVSMDYLFGYTKADEKTVPETVGETTRLGKEGKREDAIALLRQTLERTSLLQLLWNMASDSSLISVIRKLTRVNSTLQVLLMVI